MCRVIAASDKALSAHERLRILVRVVNFDGVAFNALREDGLASIKMRGWKQVERYALVGGPSWMRTVASWFAPLVRTETRFIDLNQQDQAWRWLEVEPKVESVMYARGSGPDADANKSCELASSPAARLISLRDEPDMLENGLPGRFRTCL